MAKKQTAAPVRPITLSMGESPFRNAANPFSFLLRFPRRFCPPARREEAAYRSRLACAACFPAKDAFPLADAFRWADLSCVSALRTALICVASFRRLFSVFMAGSCDAVSVRSCVSSKSSSLISQPSRKACCKSSVFFDISPCPCSLSVIVLSHFYRKQIRRHPAYKNRLFLTLSSVMCTPSIAQNAFLLQHLLCGFGPFLS